ncbi:MAG TPA: PepSY domain-containing protein [Burkholderiaceae bacterium]|nr:PepSY domain-containing protein [Burkholderiaceae bacterium]
MQPITHPNRRLLVAVAAGAALAAGVALAQTPAPAPAPAATTAATAPQLTIRDIYDRMEAAGYRDMREIEFSGGRYEVKARNAQGERVKLYVNATTGTVERTRRGD